MAIIDAQLELSDAQAVTASAASTNVIDLTATAPNLGQGSQDLYLQVICDTTADSSGDAATLDIALQDSANNSSFANVLASVQLAEASVTAGTTLFITKLPPNLRRYIRVYYTVGTENFTAGKFDAFITTTPAA